MPEDNKGPQEQVELLRAFSADDSMEDKVDSLWRQLMVYKSFADSDLSEAKIRRAEAEAAREQAEMEAVRTTKLTCERMRSDAERDLRAAEEKVAAATKAREEAESKLKKAKELRSKLEEERDQIVADAQKQAQEILEEARTTAQRETKDLRRQAFKEVKTILTRVENMRAAINEELETQRILTNVSKLKANSRRVLAEGGHEYGDGALASEGEADPPEAEQEVSGGSDDPVADQTVNGGPAGSKRNERTRTARSTGSKKPSNKS